MWAGIPKPELTEGAQVIQRVSTGAYPGVGWGSKDSLGLFLETSSVSVEAQNSGV